MDTLNEIKSSKKEWPKEVINLRDSRYWENCITGGSREYMEREQKFVNWFDGNCAGSHTVGKPN